MTVHHESYKEARLTLSNNKHAVWFSSGGNRPSRNIDARGAAERIHNGFAQIGAQPRLSVQNRVYFTIGSCFARVIESELHSRGIPVPTRDPQIYKDYPHLFRTVKEDADPASFLNRYNVPSMLQEIKILSGDIPVDPDWLLCSSGDAYVDLHYANALYDVSLEDCKHRRKLVRLQQSAAFASANTFILTLGLCEAWFDTKTQAYLDVAPPQRVTASDHERFELRFVDYETNLRALIEIYEILLRCKGNENFELILTVSPVPLNATFLDADVVVANSEAKSVLRAVAGEGVRQFPRVSYFPSYEIVSNSEPSKAWAEDGLHVRREMTKYVVATYLSTLETADR